MDKKKIVLGFIAGASVGAIIALLLSPDKGSETRKKIMDSTSDLGSSIKDCVTDWFKSAKKTATNGASDVGMKLNTMG